MDHSTTKSFVAFNLATNPALLEACAEVHNVNPQLESQRDLLLALEQVHKEGFRTFLLNFLQQIVSGDSKHATKAAAILAVLALDDCDQRAAAILHWDQTFMEQLHLKLCGTPREERH